MKRLFLSVIAISQIVASCSNNAAKEASESGLDTTMYRVKTMVLEKQKITRNLDYTSNLLAYEEIYYAPASPGRIDAINVEVGSRVAKGDVIIQMDKTQLLQAQQQYLNAQSNFQRMDTLYKLNSISEQVFEASNTQYQVAKTSYEFLLRNTTLASPINGIVTGKYFEGGELYSGAPNTSAGKAAIVTLMQISPLKAKINISESYFPMIKQGMKAVVGVDIYPEKKFSGEVFRIYPTISADTRTFTVELVISNTNELLRPGMFARVSLELGETEALILPANTLVKQEGTNDRYLYVVGSDNRTRKIRVDIGKRYDDQIEIISTQVKAGDQIVISGQEKLMDGSLITIVN